MKNFSTITKNFAIALTALGMLVGVGLSSGLASAAQIPYDPAGTPTSKTPVFNQFTNVPSGVGDESDFVRLRPSTGDVTSTSNNGAYISSLSAACNKGDKFDVRTYVHNGADPNFNLNGTGSAVAHNVQVAMTAPLGTTNSTFNFNSTVSASNAASVTDGGVLNCNGKQVKLTIVPGTVKTYSKTVGFVSETDAAVNGTLKIGSRVHGSGDQWACFDDRITIAYIVTVEELVQPKPVTATCDLFNIEVGDNRTIKVSQFQYTATNAAYKYVVINWDAGKTNASTAAITDAAQVKGQTHQYSADGTYLVSATVHFTSADNNDLVATTEKCQQQVKFDTKVPPVVTPVTVVPPTPAKPTALVNTGAGSTAALFATVTAAAAGIYQWSIRRRLV